jgi:carbonic anhydrase/acetyltransferase-like protein (isoleucine patch superfamily)
VALMSRHPAMAAASAKDPGPGTPGVQETTPDVPVVNEPVERLVLPTLKPEIDPERYEIGDHVSVGHNVTIHGATIKNYALVGMGSTILDHAVVGEGAIVAAGSLVLSNTVIEPGSIWGGVPAKFIKKVDPEQAKELNQKIAHNYLMYSDWYK